MFTTASMIFVSVAFPLIFIMAIFAAYLMMSNKMVKAPAYSFRDAFRGKGNLTIFWKKPEDK